MLKGFSYVIENFSKDNTIRFVNTLRNILQVFYLVMAMKIKSTAQHIALSLFLECILVSISEKNLNHIFKEILKIYVISYL